MDLGKRRIVVCFAVASLLLVGIAPGFASDQSVGRNPVSRDVAKRVAVNHMNAVNAQKGFSRLGTVTEGMVTELLTARRQGIDLYYVFDLDARGWVIVGADFVVSPIIAYSDEGPFSLDDPPPAFIAWMENVENEIFGAIKNRLNPLEKTTEAWKRLSVPAEGSVSKTLAPPVPGGSALSVATLLSTTWSQGGKELFILAWAETYDYYCPREVSAGHYRVAPTGCVATAMGQIMKYHAWPPTGEGSHTWDPPHAPAHGSGSGSAYTTYNAYTVDFSARNYDWASMPNKVTSEWWDIDANEKKVAQVLRDIGVAVEMDYAPGGSGACTYQKSTTPGKCSGSCNTMFATRHGSLKAFRDYFRYHATFTQKSSCYNDSSWKSRLKQELDAARPVLYSGANGGGHAFVCDGYDSSDKFHFNWGWGGSHNAYYAIGDLTPGSHNYNSENVIVYNIRPDTPPTAKCKTATLYLDGSGHAVLTASSVNNGSFDPDGSPVTVQIDKSQFNCSHTGAAQSVTLTATDNTGNTDNCVASVTIVDNVAPTVATKDITVNLNASGQASITAGAVDNGSSDACGISSRTVSPASFTCANAGPNTVTLAVTDFHGNVATKTAAVTVVDTTQPTITCPAAVTAGTDPGESTAVINGLLPTAADNCSVDQQTWTMTGATTGSSPGSGINDPSGEAFNVGVTHIAYAIEDAAGHGASCQFTVTVTDDEKPTITCPADVTVSTDPGESTAVINGLSPTTDDNCGVVLQTWSMSGATTGDSSSTGFNDVSGQIFNVGVTTVTYYVEDQHGNSEARDFTVTVTDDELPTLTCPADVQTYTDISSSLSEVLYGLSPTTDDNCGVVLQTWSLSGATTDDSPSTGFNDVSGQAFNVGVTTVAYHIEDAAGNSADCGCSVNLASVEPIPTLNEWGLVLFAVFLVMGSLFMLRVRVRNVNPDFDS